MVAPEKIKHWIEENLAGASAEVVGDGRHFEATIVCPLFAGKSMLEQHRLVYGSLGNKMESTIHALSLKTYTPQQWQAINS